ncbi:Crp/Fnr family transcriptional regulator [Pollutimonas bauzanensis]|jgi:CRP-like cAMP-binding protein|uniref:Crp/Fnr family transcriptional regulator n=1 Tax=Pollutimonas bauzanensis TaxID=658167 RepID=UPI00333FFE8B
MPAQLSRSIIKNLDLFKSLPDAALDTILQTAQVCRLNTGDAAFRQGEVADRFFVLLHGHLKVVQITPDGEQIVVRYVSPGEVFGIARAMRRPNYPASTIAVQESLALSWPSTEWEQFTTTNPHFASNALQTVGQRLQDAHSRIQELSTEEVEQRVARAILRLVDQSGQQTPEGVMIDFPITRQDIAEMTGTTLHTVSRLMSAWKERGLVTSGRKRIVVCAIDDLIRLAEGPHAPATARTTRIIVE